MVPRALARAALPSLAVLVGGAPARADLQDDAARVARIWAGRGARVERLAPVFLDHGRLHRLTIPRADAAEPCWTLALLTVRTAELLVGPSEELAAGAPFPGPAPLAARSAPETAAARQRSAGGAASLVRCGEARREMARVVVELVSARAAVEMVLARSEAPLGDLSEILPERAAGPVAPHGDTGGPLEPGPLPERIARAERRARGEGAVQVSRTAARAAGDGAGQARIPLAEGCHRVDVMAEVPASFPHRATDVDAEARDASGRLLARDHADVPDARLDFCLGEPSSVTVSFTGAAGAVPVTLSTARWPLPAHLPARWGTRARAGFAGALFRRHAPEPRIEPVFESLGGSGPTSIPFAIQPGRCYLAALAPFRGEVRSVRLTAAVGDLVVRDEAADGAAISFCAETEAVARFDADVRGNTPWWALAVWPIGERVALILRSWPALALLISACASPPPPPPAAAPPAAAPPRVAEMRVLPDAVDGRPLLAAGGARATAAGAGPLRVLGADVVAEGDRIGAFVEIPDDECLLAFTRPSPTLADTDIFAYDDDGSVFAADESPDPQATILACPPHPRRLYVVARAMAGTGVLAVGVQAVPRAAAEAVARAMGARGRAGEDSGRLDSWPGLETKIRVHRDALGGRWEDVRRVVLPTSPRAASRVSAAVEAGRCLDVLVIPSDEVASLEVVIEDAAARVVARAREHGRDHALVLCAAAAAAPVTIAVRPRATPGLTAVVLGRGTPGGEPEVGGRTRVVHLSPTVDLEAARRALGAELATAGYAAPRPVAAGTAPVGSRVVVPVDLPAGCARIDVIAGKPLVEVSASLWDDKGARIAEGRAGGSLPLFACGRGGAARLDVEAMESPGPFAVELRRDRAAPPALLAHPVAAGRLLARLHAGGAAADASAAAGAVAVSLDEAALRTLPVPVPPGQCVEVIAALDRGAAGIDLRLTDGAGEGSVTRARHVAADRVCAAPGGKPGAAELRLVTGKGEALVLMRPSAP